MAAGIEEADVARIGRAGIVPLSDERGLVLFDRALASAESLSAAMALDRAALRAKARTGTVPALLAGIVPQQKLPSRAGEPLAQRLREAPAGTRSRLAEDFVRADVAAILGHSSPAQIGPDDAFKELGFDSLAAVELRNRLSEATGLRLASSAVFDYPNVSALAAHLLALIGESTAVEERREEGPLTEEPIAIVGMACRLPGGVSTPRGALGAVACGARRDRPAARPTAAGTPRASTSPTPTARTTCAQGGFLPDAAEFDPAFFAIAPREATAMDPQQRLPLESSWEALEDAGSTRWRCGDPRPASSPASQDSRLRGVPEVEGFLGRHRRQRRLRPRLLRPRPRGPGDDGRHRLLLVAGGDPPGGAEPCSAASATWPWREASTVLATPSLFAYFSASAAWPPDGRSKAFAEAADGLGISEGGGVLVLERLSDAEAKGHRILATIRGSAVNQDGASNGLTAPNGPSQERVIRQALANAGLRPPTSTWSRPTAPAPPSVTRSRPARSSPPTARTASEPLRLGSLKSNIGHTQAAAGVAGVIKAVLAMREGMMPKTLHVDQPSSKIDWEAGKVELLTEAREWEANGHPRRAGVSSFGSDRHQRPPDLGGGARRRTGPGPGASDKDHDGEEGSSPQVRIPLALSAKGEEALAEQASRLAAHVEESPELSLADLAYSLATTRAGLQRRAVLLAERGEELAEGLSALARGERPPSATLAKTPPSPALAYLFTGQGSQRPGHGQGAL